MDPTALRSRRARPAKRPLSREWIVEVAVEMMRAEGLERVTMRRVAQALDTGPASLYVYVANAVALHDAILDQVLRELDLVGGGSADQEIERLLLGYGMVLSVNPGLARSALVVRPTGPRWLALFDRLLALLLATGATPGQAAWGTDLLLLLVTAAAAEHAGAELDPYPALAIDPAATPYLAAHREIALGGEPHERAVWAIRAALAGIRATAVRPSPTPS